MTGSQRWKDRLSVHLYADGSIYAQRQGDQFVLGLGVGKAAGQQDDRPPLANAQPQQISLAAVLAKAMLDSLGEAVVVKFAA